MPTTTANYPTRIFLIQESWSECNHVLCFCCSFWNSCYSQGLGLSRTRVKFFDWSSLCLVNIPPPNSLLHLDSSSLLGIFSPASHPLLWSTGTTQGSKAYVPTPFEGSTECYWCWTKYLAQVALFLGYHVVFVTIGVNCNSSFKHGPFSAMFGTGANIGTETVSYSW